VSLKNRLGDKICPCDEYSRRPLSLDEKCDVDARSRKNPIRHFLSFDQHFDLDVTKPMLGACALASRLNQTSRSHMKVRLSDSGERLIHYNS
jgi:hypothetical protein